MLETSNEARGSSRRSSQSDDDVRTGLDYSADEAVPSRRLGSPSDTFKDVFSEYGAKLSPSLMRLQLEGDLPLDADGPHE